jgi:hypothetical protein
MNPSDKFDSPNMNNGSAIQKLTESCHSRTGTAFLLICRQE